MKIKLLVFLFSTLFAGQAFSQYSPLGVNLGNMTTGPGGTIDVPFTAGANFQNITNLTCTFTFDPTKITWNSMQNWGLSNPSGATFTQTTPGILTFTWSSLISVGPTLPVGGLIFNLRFNVIGSIGDVSPVTFTNSPQNHTWNNGFGWSGSNFTISNGSVTIACLAPTVNYTATPNFYSYTFNNTSTNGGTYAWDFGDGIMSTTASPTHTYATAGTYTVCLISTNSCGADTMCQTINVCTNMPVSNFTITSSQLNISCTDATTFSPNTWSWNFGNGGTSTVQNPTYTYPSVGTYNVCLTSGNGCGTSTSCQNVTVSCIYPTAAWTNTSINLNASFTNVSTGLPTSYSWNFGNGVTSTSQNPTHTYSATGTYNVCLIATNVCGSDTLCQNITITCPVPVASWTNTTNGLSSTFSNTSTNSPTSNLWTFGNGASSTQTSPTHVYLSEGVYNVCLFTNNTCGNTSSCQTITIVCPNTNAAFSNSVSNYTASFTDLSMNTPTSWSWNFGDGTTSTAQNPSHTYTANGTYNVCLISSNACGADTVCDSVVISCLGPVTYFQMTTSFITGIFTDMSGNNPTAWFWEFGDGSTSTAQNPAHVYGAHGAYQVCLTTYNQCDSNKFCATLFLQMESLDELPFGTFNVSPNPASDYFQINTTFEGKLKIQLINLQGKLIREFEAKNEDKLEIQNVAKGNYILLINDGTNSGTYKLSVQ